MFIETIDLLRCPRDHEETWLVAAFTKMNGRFVADGKLGCPICNASYSITDGVADFRGDTSAAPIGAAAEANDQDAMMLAAFLNLVREGSTVVLEGEEARHAVAVANITRCRVIALNPSANVEETELTSTVRSGGRIPLATRSVDGVASGDQAVIRDAPRVLRAAGRIVVPAESELPPELREIARDDERIIGESVGPLVGLSR